MFLLAEVIPGDPALTYAGPGATPGAAIAEARVHLGLNQPLPEQHWMFLVRLVQGNFGISVFTHRPIGQDLATVPPPSIELVAVATVINILIGIPLGVLAAARPGGFTDGITRLMAMIGAGVPPFFLAILLQYVFAYRLGFLPLTGEAAVNANLGHAITGFPLIDTLLQGQWSAFGSVVAHLIMPAVALALGFSGVIMRTVRSSMLGTLGEEYIVLGARQGTAGAPRAHPARAAQRAAAEPDDPRHAGGLDARSSVLVETVYSYPGIGNYSVTALFESDLWAVVGVVVDRRGVRDRELRHRHDPDAARSHRPRPAAGGDDVISESALLEPLSDYSGPLRRGGGIRLRSHPLELAAGVVAVVIVGIAIFGPLVASGDPYTVSFQHTLNAPSAAHLFGTDDAGRDVLLRVIYGARTTLSAVAVVLLIAASVGTDRNPGRGRRPGGRRVPDARHRHRSVLPAAGARGSDFGRLRRRSSGAIAAIALSWWPGYARLVRTLVGDTADKPFVQNARVLGVSKLRPPHAARACPMRWIPLRRRPRSTSHSSPSPCPACPSWARAPGRHRPNGAR